MAILTSLDLKFNFETRIDNIKVYEGVLTTEQITELQSLLVKAFTIDKVYAKISEIKGDKENITIWLNFYNDETKIKLLDRKSYKFIPSLDSTENFIKQGYEYLKKIPEYMNAVDC